MEVVGFWVFFLVVGPAFMLPSCSSTNGMTLPTTENSVTTTSIGKGGSYSLSSKMRKIYKDNMNLEDYGQIDPAPSSTATITSGPIEHGTPLMPYIPKPTPPYHPDSSGSPLPPLPA